MPAAPRVARTPAHRLTISQPPTSLAKHASRDRCGAPCRSPGGAPTNLFTRLWSDQAIACTIPGLLALFLIVPGLVLQPSEDRQLSVPETAWYHTTEPTVVDGWASVRRHLWRARSFVNAAAEAKDVQCPHEAFGLLPMASRERPHWPQSSNNRVVAGLAGRPLMT